MPTSRFHCALSLAIVLLATVAGPARGAAVESAFGGRVPCHQEQGVQYCEGSAAGRVETWDGVPLDVNLTLPPAAMSPPFPLIVELHGWSLGKANGPFVARALAGYAVLSYSARGFHQSCGFPASRAPDPLLSNPNACTERGWIHLGDARYEARDTQYLAGLLVDAGLVDPDRIGVTGVSYGGLQSLILGALHDRIMLPDGTLRPWTSPAGRPLRIAAAAPLVPPSDLAYSLVPNGRTLDYRARNPYGVRAGIQKQSWNAVLYGAGASTGFYAPPGADPSADIQGWQDRMNAGEPYDGSPALLQMVDEITRYHSAYYIDDSSPPAPLFIYNAWTDDLFPVDEALRFWRKAVHRHPSAEIALYFADAFGHPRAGLGGDIARVVTRVEEFFARHLKGAAVPRPAPVEAHLQACGGTSAGGAFTATDWDAIHPGEVRLAFPGTKRFASAGGNPATAAALDPFAGGSCRTVPATDDAGAATYRLPTATGSGYTLLGSPTVIADLAVRGLFAQVAARLWDVAPNGTQTLVTHALYRPRTDNVGPQVFQLHPNGWRFAAGHLPKLELLGQSVPYGRASNGTFTISVTDVELRLPVAERPDGTIVRAPAPYVFPSDAAEPPPCPPAPVSQCRAGASTLRLADRAGDARDRLVWRWRGAGDPAADVGDPIGTGFALCVYDGGARLLMGATVPAATACVGTSCWIKTPGGFRYHDREPTRTGVTRADLHGGASARIGVRAGGQRLGLPALPVAHLPLTVQLTGGDGACWGATLRAHQNAARRLSATSR